jgi:cohesin loading factor subunit SCC2
MGLIDVDLKYCTLQSLGSVCIRHNELMLTDKLRDMYHELLLDSRPASVKLRIQTLHNIETFLQEEDIRMMKEDQECKYILLRVFYAHIGT